MTDPDLLDVDGRAVGRAALFDFDTFARHAEAGISLVAEARGRGIGTAAITQLVEFGFVRRNLRRIHLQAIASNTAAIRAYEKAGFVTEGRRRQHAWVRGGYEDIVLMGILRAEPAGPARIDMVVDLGLAEDQRLPPWRMRAVLGVELPLVLGPFTPHLSAALRQYLLAGRAD